MFSTEGRLLEGLVLTETVGNSLSRTGTVKRTSKEHLRTGAEG